MEIFGETIERELPDLAEQGVRVRFIGRRDRAPDDAARADGGAGGARPPANDRLDLWIAFDYGGRAELVEAARRLVETGVDPSEVDEDALAARLYAPELPDPDLLIRTSGELRISNFLLWQLAYAELVFVDTLWPDFGADAAARGARRVRAAAGAASAADELRSSSRAPRRGRRRCRSSLGLVWLGGWWLFALARRRRAASRCTSSTR